MIQFAVSFFGLLVALICGLLIKSCYKAAIVAILITLIFPYLVLLYLGHGVSGFGIGDLLVISLLSAVCSYVVSRSRHSSV